MKGRKKSTVIKIDDENKECSNDIEDRLQDIEKKESLDSPEKLRLRTLKITLKYEVPPQHQIETRAGSHAPSPEQRKLFESYIVPKHGVYAPEEDEMIVHNWKEFCKLHKWNHERVVPFLNFKNANVIYFRSKRERRKFVQFLAHGLPNRTLYSVYHRFKNLYDHHLQRRYRPEEDSIIIDHLENNPNLNEKRKFADLAKVLNRTRASVWRRYKVLKKKQTKMDD